MSDGSTEAAKPKRKGSWRRRLGWAAVVIVVLVGLGILGLWQGVPAVAKHVVMPRISERLNGEATLDEATFNPFTLRLELKGIEVVDDAGQSVAGVSGVVADVKWETLWTWVPTLSELAVTDPSLDVVVEASTGEVNLFTLLEPMRSAEPRDEPDSGLKLPEVIVEKLTVSGAALSSRLILPPPREPFEHAIGPASVTLVDVRTAPGEDNAYVIESALPGGATAKWTGDVVLHELKAEGDLVVSDVDVPLYNNLLDGQLGCVIDSGEVDVEVGYTLTLLPPEPTFDTELRSVELIDLAARAYDGEAPFYRLDRFYLSGLTAEVEPTGPVLRIGRVEIGQGAFEIDQMPGKPPPLQDLLTLLLHQGFAGFADDIRDDMRRIERASGGASGAVAGAGADGESPTDLREVAVQIASRAAANGAVPVTAGQLNAQELLIAALGPWQLRIDEVEVGKQESTLHGDPFVGIEAASVTGVTTKTQPLGFEVESALLTGPWAELVLSDARELVVAKEAGARIAESAAATPEYDLILAAEPADPDAKVQLLVKEAQIVDGYVTVVDGGTDPTTEIRVDRIAGTVANFSSDPEQAADVAIEAWINGVGVVETRGTASVMSDPIVLDMRAETEGVELPAFTPYGGAYLGFAIDSGAATTETDFDLNGSAMAMDNRIVLKDFYLGEKIESDQAVNVPVKLGLDLLRDRDGVIDIELPVSGDLNDPEIDMSLVVQEAINNLLGKILTAPFEFIASAFAGEGEEGLDLSRMDFDPGSAEMTARDDRKAEVLRKALAERPGLTLAVTGRYDASADGGPMKRAELDRRVEAWLAERRASPIAEREATVEPTRRDAIEAMYVALGLPGGAASGGPVETGEASGGADTEDDAPHAVARGARGRGTAASGVQTGDLTELFGGDADESNATAESSEPATASSGDAAGAAAVSDEQMLAAVLERMPVSEASLVELANGRAEAVVAALMSGEDPIDASRVTATEPEAGEMAVTFSLE
ncbi:MAG: DUF748 domain-containing protein [Planctomycetota bacterium]